MISKPFPKKLEAARIAWEAACDALYSDSEAYVLAEVAAWSLRLGRAYTVTVYGGNGTLFARVNKGDTTWSISVDDTHVFKQGKKHLRAPETPEFFNVIERLEAETRVPGLGSVGHLIFHNGVQA